MHECVSYRLRRGANCTFVRLVFEVHWSVLGVALQLVVLGADHDPRNFCRRAVQDFDYQVLVRLNLFSVDALILERVDVLGLRHYFSI